MRHIVMAYRLVEYFIACHGTREHIASHFPKAYMRRQQDSGLANASFTKIIERSVDGACKGDVSSNGRALQLDVSWHTWDNRWRYRTVTHALSSVCKGHVPLCNASTRQLFRDVLLGKHCSFCQQYGRVYRRGHPAN